MGKIEEKKIKSIIKPETSNLEYNTEEEIEETIEAINNVIESGENEEKKGRQSILEKLKEDKTDKKVAMHIYNMACNGYSRTRIQKELEKMGYSKGTWKQMTETKTEEYPIYKRALQAGEIKSINQVEQSLKNSAVGYYVKEEKTVTDGSGVPKTTITKRYISPSFQSQQFYLTNMLPDKYKVKKQVSTEVTANVNESIDLSNLSVDILREIKKGIKDNKKNKIEIEDTEVLDIKDSKNLIM